MADIRFDYVAMKEAVEEIRSVGGLYKEAGNTFGTDFAEATKNWTGESKDKMMGLINNKIIPHLTDGIPGLVENLAQILEANISQMKNADTQIGESIK